MTAKHGLGRGLDALIVGDPAQYQTPALAGDQITQIPLTDIDPNRDQPRRRFDEKALSELADSIKSVGVISPVIVRQSGDRYQLIAGERRWRAARLAGLSQIPAIVRDWDEARRLEVTLIENLQRDDLNPIEEAAGVRSLMDSCGYTQEAAAQRLGKSRSALANLLRLLTLPDKVCELVRAGRLSAGHARALAALPDPDTQTRLANLCASQGWSVRQLERICASHLEGEPREPKPEKPRRPRECQQLERMARDVFGTKAQLDGDLTHGRLVLHYSSQDDLQRIWERLEGMRHGE